MVALLDGHAEVDHAAEDGVTALIMAAKNGHGRCITELLNRRADVQIRDCENYTALDWARRNIYPRLVEMLSKASPPVPSGRGAPNKDCALASSCMAPSFCSKHVLSPANAKAEKNSAGACMIQ